MKAKTRKYTDELSNLQNVGTATRQDLTLLGINTVKELAQADPDELYLRLQQITHCKQDPCVWDVFAAIIHEAKTGVGQPWWQWTAIRKERQNAGDFINLNNNSGKA